MLLKKFLKFLVEITVAVLVLAAVLFGITRSLLPFINRYQAYLETWASHAIDHPVTIGKVAASWRGLHPVFSFDHITIYDNTRKTQLLKIKQLQISINLFASMVNKQIIPAEFRVSGTYLSIHQLENNNFNINGINLHFALQQPGNSNIQQFLEQVLEQGQIFLDNFDVDWYGKNSMVLPVTNLKLKLSKRFFEHQLIGVATLIQKKSVTPIDYKATNFPWISAAPKPSICMLPQRIFHGALSAKFLPTCLLPPSKSTAQETSAQVRFVLNLHGDILRKSQLSADGYVYIKNLQLQQWAPWLKNQVQNGFSLVAGNLSELQLWANWGNQQLQQIQGVFKLQDGLLRPQTTGNMINLNALDGNMAWQRNHSGWDLAVDHLHLNINKQLWPLTQFSIQVLQPAGQPGLQLYRADNLELAPLANLLSNSPWIANDVNAILQTVQPIGEIKNLLIWREVPVQTPDKSSVSASADFEHVALKPWKQLPEISNLTGHVFFSPTAGDAQLSGKNLSVAMVHMFRQPLIMRDYQARIQWLQTPDGLKFHASDLAFNNSTLSLRGDMDLYLPSAGPPFIHLLGGFSVDDIKQLPQYIPARILKPKLTAWLDQAFAGGDNINGQILLQGPVSHFPFADNTGRFEITAHATNLDFSFHSGWPLATDVNADALLNGKRLQIAVSHAKILGIPINPVQGEIADLVNAPLEIQGSVAADMHDALRFIAASPLKTPLAGLLQLNLHGPMQLNLKMEVPLHEESHAHELPKVNGDITLMPGGVAELPAWNISMDQLHGAISFTEHSAQAQGLQANWLGQPVAISVQSAQSAPGHSMTTIQLTGNAAMDALVNAYKLDALRNIIKGEVSYQAKLQFAKDNGKSQNSLLLNSDLQGVAINLPDPVKKSAASKVPTQIRIDFGQQNQLKVFVSLAKKLSAAFNIDSDKSGKHFLQGGNIRFGDTPAALSGEGGLIIDGRLARLNWSEVNPFIAPYLSRSKAANASSPALEINRIILSIEELDAFGMQVAQANIQARPLAAAWDLQIISPAIVGKMLLPKDFAHQAIQGHFQRFTFVPGPSENTQGIEPAKLPPLNLFFQDFRYKERALGQLTLVTFPQNHALIIERLILHTPNLNLSARGLWQGSGNRQRTTLSGNIKSTDLGATLKAWQLTGSLKGGEGKAAFALSWPAAAYKYNSASLNGRFSLNFTKGRIINISQGTEAEMGIGRILNLLSLQSLPRRLSLDFSDLFSKGFTFDTMKGDFAIIQGNMTTNNTYLNGPIGKVEAQGRIGLGAKDYNLIMTITPYITSNIPVIATIAGGPIVGAAAWVANKIFGGIVNQITSHAYSVRGSWASPVIEKISAQERRNQPNFGTMTVLPNTIGN